MPATTRKRKYGKRSSAKRKSSAKRVYKRRRTSSKRGGNRRLNARPNSSMHISKPIRATNANKRRKSSFTINFKDLALSIYPEHKGRYINQGHTEWTRGFQSVQLVSFGHPGFVFRELLKAAFTREDFRSKMHWQQNSSATTAWFNAPPSADIANKTETGYVDNYGLGIYSPNFLFVPRNDIGTNDDSADMVRWYPNSKTNLYATIYQKHIVTVVNPTQVTMEINIYTSRPKHYLLSDKQRIIGCWNADNITNQAANSLRPTLVLTDPMAVNMNTGLESFDMDWPMTPVDSDQIVHSEKLLSIPGEKPFIKRNETISHHHSKIGEIVKVLAPGEEFKFAVEIPTYKFNPSLLLRDLHLRREDTAALYAEQQINAQSTSPATLEIFDEMFKKFIHMPIGWKYQKDITIIAKCQNTFATNVTPYDHNYENSYMVEDGSNINPIYGIHNGAGQVFFKVDSRITTRCLPLQQRTVYSYVDNSRGSKTIPVGNSNHPRETVVNVESDNQQHVHASTYDNPYNPTDTDTVDPDLVDVVDGIA